MTPADIAALRALVDAATPGPWKPSVWIETDGDEWRATGPGHDQHAHDYGSEPGGPDEQAAQRDAAFICAARSALPALLDRIEELERERDEARRERDAFSYDTLTRERNQLADEVREQADDLLGLQELAPPVELFSRICKQAHEWRTRLANVQLRLDVAEIADDPTADVWRRESSRVDVLTAARDKLAREVAEATADVANLRAGHCLAVIPETFIACGEGGNCCSETCRLRTLLAETVEIGQRLAGLECDSAAEEHLAAIAKEAGVE